MLLSDNGSVVLVQRRAGRECEMSPIDTGLQPLSVWAVARQTSPVHGANCCKNYWKIISILNGQNVSSRARIHPSGGRTEPGDLRR